MTNYQKIIESFGFKQHGDLLNSLFPSIKYQILGFTITLSAISSFANKLFGLEALTILAFVFMLMMEFASGIIASKIKGKRIESRLMGRFLVKVFLWLTCLFFIHTLQMDYEAKSKLIAGSLQWLHSGLMIYVSLEYLISILENIAVISGKSNDVLIKYIRKKINQLLGDE